jgi:hypothetical protein
MHKVKVISLFLHADFYLVKTTSSWQEVQSQEFEELQNLQEE